MFTLLHRILYVVTQTLHNKQDERQGQFLNGVKLIWIHGFPSSSIGWRTKAKESSWAQTFAKMWSETQTALSRIWTRVTDTISHSDNCYGKCVSSGWDVRGSLNKFPDFYRTGTFIGSTDLKLQGISSGCNALVVSFQQLLEGSIEVLLCERVSDLRHSLFHLLNGLITTASELRE